MLLERSGFREVHVVLVRALQQVPRALWLYRSARSSVQGDTAGSWSALALEKCT